jgi:HSP20 family molecular chaperone IbpA
MGYSFPRMPFMAVEPRQTKNFKSHIMLPRKLRDYEPVGAKLEDGFLKIRLEK